MASKRAHKMTEAEIEAAAKSDSDNPPLSETQLARMRRVPFAKRVRRKFGLSQETFAERFQIPLGTLRDWEQGRREPDQAARAYLIVIDREPLAVNKALSEESMERKYGLPPVPKSARRQGKH